MKHTFLHSVLFVFVCCKLFSGVVCNYECIMPNGGALGGGLGSDMDDFEAGEMGEMDELQGRGLMKGTVVCSNRGNILVKRVAYGVGFGRCQSFSYCQEEYEMGGRVADRCDGLSTCYIDFITPRFLSCGRSSNYLMVEYECLDSWSTFEVCSRESNVIRNPNVFVLSPGYLNFRGPVTSKRGTQMCECILQSRNKDDLYMEFLQTDLSSDNDKCPYDYVTIETKADLNQTKIKKELEVCGRRHVGGKWYNGSIRVTYASGGPMQKRGLAVKFTADNKGYEPQIEIDCGPVDAKHIKLSKRPPSSSGPNTGSQDSSVGGAPSWGRGILPPLDLPSLQMREMFDPGHRLLTLGRDESFLEDSSELYKMGLAPPGLPPLSPFYPMNQPLPSPTPYFWNRPPPPTRTTDIRDWKINLPAQSEKQPKSSAWPPVAQKPKAPVPAKRTPVAANKPESGSVVGQGRTRAVVKNKRPVKKFVQQDGPVKSLDSKPEETDISHEETPIDDANSKGGFAGLVIGGIGAALILGSVAILAVKNYQKRKRIKREEAAYYGQSENSSTYGRGWETEESVYATVGEVEMNRLGCVNPGVSDTDFGDQTTTKAEDKESTLTSLPLNGKEVRNKSNNYEPQITIRPNNRTSSNQSMDIAVIEVHATQDSGAIEAMTCTELDNFSVSSEYMECPRKPSEDDVNQTTCSDYALVRNARAGSEAVCSGCSLTVPPRKKRATKRTVDDYDNNVGVRTKAKKF